MRAVFTRQDRDESHAYNLSRCCPRCDSPLGFHQPDLERHESSFPFYTSRFK
jgi:hypothetical protein